MSNIEALEQKYSLLKDQMTNITKLVSDEKEKKEKMKNKSSEEIKQLEAKLKNMFNEERENSKMYVESSFKKIEEQMLRMETNIKKDNEGMNNNLLELKEFIDVFDYISYIFHI